MPDFSVVDTHLHIWDPQKLSYPWLADIPLLNRPYLIEDYREATAGLSVERMVFLQCEVAFEQCVEEAAWVAGVARQEPRIQGIVAWAPLELGAAATETLDQLADIPGLKGIRRIIQFEPNTEFCLQPGFIEGVRLLEHYGLSFDICIKGDEQFANTLELVRQCPNVSFILDHIGKPDIVDGGRLDPWRQQLRDLAAFDNTICKVSGLVGEADMEHWTREDLKPYLDTVFNTFGFDRVAFGGDWPVVLQAAQYREWVAALDWALEGISDDEKRKVYRDNAIRFYKLEE